MNTRYSNDWDGYCDMRADATELEHDRAREPYECDGCFELTNECTCPTLPIAEECATCAAMGFDCRPAAGSDRVECPGAACVKCDHAYSGKGVSA